ncbi:ribonuclease H-like protein [Stereum hirsutum FP-91666 SS1]|uniref:ribonuclease H-like protein n=1 Tax=Stereum hirsutum (strain FP-91666) TaxID=721885 RepID=UPI000440D76F|nr:ribonuclease H-like protein [Stereum hirsutum FP-91666 SS1]EIM92825.1 ribonuclease H-like protein [Stereum hirsutum FP-91666 SS1]
MPTEGPSTEPHNARSSETTGSTSSAHPLQATSSPGKRPRVEEDEEDKADLVGTMLNIYFDQCSDTERRDFKRRVYEVERNKAIQAFVPSSLVLTRPLVCFDFETTDLLPHGRILSMSFIKVHPRSGGASSNKVEVFMMGNLRPTDGSVYVNPGVPSHPAALKVHRIKDSDLSSLPPFSAHAQSLLAFLKGCDLLGHNIKVFDVELLVKEFKLCNIDWSPDTAGVNLLDTKQLYSQFDSGGNLESAYRKYVGDEMQGAHNAEADTIATLRVLCGMVTKSAKIRDAVEHILRPTTAVAGPRPSSSSTTSNVRPSPAGVRRLVATMSSPAVTK